jgi:hypothetical protein
VWSWAGSPIAPLAPGERDQRPAYEHHARTRAKRRRQATRRRAGFRKAGIDPAKFERFVTRTYNRAWEGAVAGMKGYIAKADRGAHKGNYALC